MMRERKCELEKEFKMIKWKMHVSKGERGAYVHGAPFPVGARHILIDYMGL